ncbi:hypothetical protein NIBR502770_06730 [Pseudarthrobacter sp. NIBRBAC000502770]|nr:hypothetical protein NIBR502770_06730 [Pseudarthrobacter sp. NIBRBAC000502770]
MKPVLVVMGVSGAGKSTVGYAPAERTGAVFIDSDSLHPAANVQKMAAGNPLDDQDRRPWLELVGAELASWHPDGILVASSTLKRAYRDAIRAQAPRRCSRSSAWIFRSGEPGGPAPRSLHGPLAPWNHAG